MVQRQNYDLKAHRESDCEKLPAYRRELAVEGDVHQLVHQPGTNNGEQLRRSYMAIRPICR
jgi:hypothetical protein